MNNQIITISYYDIIYNKVNIDDIRSAFGIEGNGIILVKDLPNFQKERKKLLNLSRKFANLPDDIKEKYIDPKSNYAFGWSHGKEKMKKDTPDFAKGSYYANPIYDKITDNKVLLKKYPATYGENIWPKEDLPELEIAFKNMGKIMYNLGLLICREIDKYLCKITKGKHKLNTFYYTIKKSRIYKGRLLHYYQMDKKINKKDDGLCGWHLDHGCITILTAPLYYDLEGNIKKKPKKCGLQIKDRKGNIIQVDIPEDCLALQIGEMFQILSGGLVRATPHCVKSSIESNITREQFPLFMDCEPELLVKFPEYSLPREKVVITPYLPEGVPSLKSRLEGVQNYRDFVVKTLDSYYN
jgi:isopenicillin N synthase-like dioxygenase